MLRSQKTPKRIFALQIASITFIWVFVSGVTLWIMNLIKVSIELQDSPNASVMISIVVIPIFILLASILTYVFVGLQRSKYLDSAPDNEGD